MKECALLIFTVAAISSLDSLSDGHHAKSVILKSRRSEPALDSNSLTLQVNLVTTDNSHPSMTSSKDSNHWERNRALGKNDPPNKKPAPENSKPPVDQESEALLKLMNENSGQSNLRFEKVTRKNRSDANQTVIRAFMKNEPVSKNKKAQPIFEVFVEKNTKGDQSEIVIQNWTVRASSKATEQHWDPFKFGHKYFARVLPPQNPLEDPALGSFIGTSVEALMKDYTGPSENGTASAVVSQLEKLLAANKFKVLKADVGSRGTKLVVQKKPDIYAFTAIVYEIDPKFIGIVCQGADFIYQFWILRENFVDFDAFTKSEITEKLLKEPYKEKLITKNIANQLASFLPTSCKIDSRSPDADIDNNGFAYLKLAKADDCFGFETKVLVNLLASTSINAVHIKFSNSIFDCEYIVPCDHSQFFEKLKELLEETRSMSVAINTARSNNKKDVETSNEELESMIIELFGEKTNWDKDDTDQSVQGRTADDKIDFRVTRKEGLVSIYARHVGSKDRKESKSVKLSFPLVNGYSQLEYVKKQLSAFIGQTGKEL